MLSAILELECLYSATILNIVHESYCYKYIYI